MDTFVVRLWSPADHAAASSDAPRGVARHVGTGHAAAFRDAEELLSLLRELPHPDVHADPSIPTDPGEIDR